MRKNTINDLNRLFELFNSGQINKEEFELLKSKIISPQKTESSDRDFLKEEVHAKNQQIKEEEIKTKVEEKPEQKSKTISIAGKVVFGLVFIGLIVASILFFRASNDRDDATISLASAEKRIEQLSASLDSLILVSTTNQINPSSVSIPIPIPAEIRERISIINKYFPDMIPQDAALSKINDGESFELRFPDLCSGFSDVVFHINIQDSDLWIYNEPPCGSGGGSTTGVFQFSFSKNNLVLINTTTSCSGASDCVELVNVYVNGENIKSLRDKL